MYVQYVFVIIGSFYFIYSLTKKILLKYRPIFVLVIMIFVCMFIRPTINIVKKFIRTLTLYVGLTMKRRYCLIDINKKVSINLTLTPLYLY